jgi:hypothetical protein
MAALRTAGRAAALTPGIMTVSRGSGRVSG